MNLSTDYLIVGSGAIGMAFADVLLEETDASLIIVDRYAEPGGHWNHAYSFVRLHQPAAFYGVSSRELSGDKRDQDGLNKGFSSLSSLPEIKSYYKAVMEEQFLSSGRVRYFPQCEYKGDCTFASLETGEEFKVDVQKKIINATHLTTKVPSTHTPNFTYAEGVNFQPINALPRQLKSPKHYCIIGGGKTGMDAIIYLLENKIPPTAISWVVSRDSWVIDRATTQNTEAFFETTIGNQANQFEALAQANSLDDLFQRLEEKGVLMRLDKSIKPTQFHGATTSRSELKWLQKITRVIRRGHVTHIEDNTLFFKDEKEVLPDHTLFVDCSATPIDKRTPQLPIFQDKVITPQTVRSYQPAFSAAFIAHVEVNYSSDEEKNKLCAVVPLPDRDTDWLTGLAASMQNQFNWSNDKALRAWTVKNRLDGFSQLIQNADKNDPVKQEIVKRMKSHILPAMMKLQELIRQLDTNTSPAIQFPQFQVDRKLFFTHQIADIPAEHLHLKRGEILVKIDLFAYTANNITYAATGDLIRYWEFFPSVEDPSNKMGVIPVWGFAEVVESNVDELPTGERIYGYFPPAKFLKMAPINIHSKRFFDGASHRSSLPMGYNLYRRVYAEPDYSKEFDRERAILFPLYLTSFCLWDNLQQHQWYGAEQILVLSASSKTSIGLGYALQDDPEAPTAIGITSDRHLKTVKDLSIWDRVEKYTALENINYKRPTVIVDMSGNAVVLNELYQLLGEQMKFTLKVGLTHWSKANSPSSAANDSSQFFFAPSHIEKRIKDWGPEEFDRKTSAFLRKAAMKTRSWLDFNVLEGLAALSTVHPEVCQGRRSPKEGIIIKLPS